MRALLFFLILAPIKVWAQADTLRPVRTDSLKVIGSDIFSGYGRYGRSVRTQYTYDGLDVRHPKELGKYILVSGDPNAIREFNAYITSRQGGGWLIAGGITSALIGGIIMGSNGPGTDGKFTTQQAIVCPTGYACGGSATGGKLVYGGQIAGYQTVTDTHRQNTYAAGSVMLLGGAILAGIGWGMHLPGQHFRRAVQYYNRTLRQRGISWQLTPYSTFSNSGVGLVGQF